MGASRPNSSKPKEPVAKHNITTTSSSRVAKFSYNFFFVSYMGSVTQVFLHRLFDSL